MNDQRGKCPICGEGLLHPQVGKNFVSYKAQTAELDLHYSVCDHCGSEQAAAPQLRDNKRALLAFKKQVDGLLSGAEVRALRLKLNLSQAEAAKIFGGGPVAFSKYETDDVVQSEAMDRLLRLAATVPGALDDLRRRAGLVGAAVTARWTAALMVPAHEERHTLTEISSWFPESEQDWSKCA